MRQPELLPCPFCGGTARWQAEAVVCTQCYIDMPAFLQEGRKGATVRAWNYRAPLTGKTERQQQGRVG